MSWTSKTPTYMLERLCEWLDVESSIKGQMKAQVVDVLKDFPDIAAWLVGEYKEEGGAGKRKTVVRDTGFNSPVVALFVAKAYKGDQSILTDENKKKLVDFDYLASRTNTPQAAILNVIKMLENVDLGFEDGMSMITTAFDLWTGTAGKVGDVLSGQKIVVEVDGDNPPGFNWWDLENPENRQEHEMSEQEHQLMGHCANNADGWRKPGDRVYSLRQWVGTDHKQVRPVATVIFNGGFLGEMKGKGNNKPSLTFAPYFAALFSSSHIKGICASMGYKQEADFKFEDLDDKQRKDVMSKNPDLLVLDRKNLKLFMQKQDEGIIPDKFKNPGLEVIKRYLNNSGTISAENLTKLIEDGRHVPEGMSSNLNPETIPRNWEKAAMLFGPQLTPEQKKKIFERSRQVACQYFPNDLTPEQVDEVVIENRGLAVEYLGNRITPQVVDKWLMGARDEQGILISTPHRSFPFIMSVIKCLRKKDPNDKNSPPYLTMEQMEFILKNSGRMESASDTDDKTWLQMMCSALLRYQRPLVNMEVTEDVELPDPENPSRNKTEKKSTKPILNEILTRMPTEYVIEADMKDLVKNFIPVAKNMEKNGGNFSDMIRLIENRGRMPYFKNALTQELADSISAEVRGGGPWIMKNVPYLVTNSMWEDMIKQGSNDDVFNALKTGPLEIVRKHMSEICKRLTNHNARSLVQTAKERGLADQLPEDEGMWASLAGVDFDYMVKEFPQKISKHIIKALMDRDPLVMMSKYPQFVDSETLNAGYIKNPDVLTKSAFNLLNDDNKKDALQRNLKSVLGYFGDRGKKEGRDPANMIDENEFFMIINGQPWMIGDANFISAIGNLLKRHDFTQKELAAIFEKQPSFATAYLNSVYSEEQIVDAINRIPNGLPEIKKAWTEMGRTKSPMADSADIAVAFAKKMAQIPAGLKAIDSDAKLKSAYNTLSEEFREEMTQSPAMIPENYSELTKPQFNKKIIAIADPAILESVLSEIYKRVGTISRINDKGLQHVISVAPETAIRYMSNSIDDEILETMFTNNPSYMGISNLEWSSKPVNLQAMLFMADTRKGLENVGLSHELMNRIVELEGWDCINYIIKGSSSRGSYVNDPATFEKIVKEPSIDIEVKISIWRRFSSDPTTDTANHLADLLIGGGSNDSGDILYFINQYGIENMIGDEKIRALYDKYRDMGGGSADRWTQLGIADNE